MKNIFPLSLLFLTVVFGCKKDGKIDVVTNACHHPIPTRIAPKHYRFGPDFPVKVDYSQSHCGYLPLGKKNYWVYRDSAFDYYTGQFQSTYIDTLRYTETHRGTDSIVWWLPDLYVLRFPPYFKGLPDYVYSTDTVLYTISYGGGVGGTPTAKWFTTFYTDSISSGQIWDDTGGTLGSYGYKHNTPVTVPAGIFENCVYYRQTFDHRNNNSGLHIYVKPGVGIIKSKSIGGATGIILTRTSTLLSYHIE